MYSGLAISSKNSGRIFGVHQKIDRVAYNNLGRLPGEQPWFPDIKQILHFEGLNGPDGLKKKSPAKDEPWHYIDPTNPNDKAILSIISDHSRQLSRALKQKNPSRAAFEAAWLSHAVVDGLTPAHHYPYEVKLAELRGGEGLETRTTIRKKWFMTGETAGQKIQNNWKAWGPNGLFITHSSFEAGVAAIIAFMSLKSALPTAAEMAEFQRLGCEQWFLKLAKEVAELDLFEKFVSRGWSERLARQVQVDLIPLLVKAIVVVWHGAAELAAKAK
ncbi:MAG: hypothetical protein ACREGF_03100 [Candidatus Saccharimonadales bacterium]